MDGMIWGGLKPPPIFGSTSSSFKAINMTHIESRFKSFARDGPSFHIDFQGSLKAGSIGHREGGRKGVEMGWLIQTLEIFPTQKFPIIRLGL